MILAFEQVNVVLVVPMFHCSQSRLSCCLKRTWMPITRNKSTGYRAGGYQAPTRRFYCRVVIKFPQYLHSSVLTFGGIRSTFFLGNPASCRSTDGRSQTVEPRHLRRRRRRQLLETGKFHASPDLERIIARDKCTLSPGSSVRSILYLLVSSSRV